MKQYIPLFKKVPLRVKFLAFFLLSSIIPFLVAMFVIIVYLQGTEKESAIALNTQIANRATQEIEQFIIRQYEILQTLSDHHEFVDQRNRQLELDTTIFKNDSFVEMTIVDMTGKELNRRHQTKIFDKSELKDRSNLVSFLTVKQNGWFLGPAFFVEGRPYFEIGVDIIHIDNTFEGAVFAIVDARVMQDVVNKTSVLNNRGRAYIVDNNGNLIAHPDISQVLAQKNFSWSPAVNTLKASSDSYQNELNEDVVGIAVPITLNFNNKDKAILLTQWRVIVEQPVSVVLATVYQITKMMLIILVGILLIAAILMFTFARRIVSPIEQLYTATREFGMGNLEHRVKIQTHDEIEDLANSFNNMANQIKKQIEDLKKLDKLKDEFLALVSHNLRTPLTEIKNYFFMMHTDQALPPQISQVLEKIKGNIAVLTKLVEEVLYITTINPATIYLKFEETDLRLVVSEATKQLETQVLNKKINIQTNIEKNLPQIKINKERIQDVIVNLLDNAIKFSHENGIIEITLKNDGTNIVVSVKDHGVGMDQVTLKSLFEKFHRGTDYLVYDYPGIGLGLYYSKIVIQSHGGKIWADSIKGVGSNVQFSLPLKASL